MARTTLKTAATTRTTAAAARFSRQGLDIGQWLTVQLALGNVAVLSRLLEIGDIGDFDTRMHPADKVAVRSAARRAMLWCEAYSERASKTGPAPSLEQLSAALAAQVRRQLASTK